MHGSQHAGDKLVNSETLLDQRDEGGYPAFIVCGASELGEYEFLEGFYLILQGHEIGDGFEAESRSARQALWYTHPSLGSSMFFKLMYSSYSKRPLNSG